MFDDLLADRRLSRRLTYAKYAVIATLGLSYLGVLGFGFFKSAAQPIVPGGYAAMIRIEGEIGPGKAASAERLNPLLEKAFADVNAKGVILRINSPGGTPVQSALINDRILQLKKQYPEKKVVAVAEDMMTSGAYFISVAADKIVVNRSTIAGSIGVITKGFGFQGLMDKLGVERRVVTAGESKNMMDPFGPQTDDERTKQSELLSAIHKHFIDAVKAGRGARLHMETPNLFSGTVWTGEEAVQLGLADTLGDIESAAQASFGTKNIHEYAPARGLLESLISGVSVQAAALLKPEVEGPQLLPR
ncbi:MULTISPECIES: S49 family peptidase [unclassified Variovorax]|nr:MULTISPECIES: S49 family peptidase [unclassified Variovorax]KWT98485.1 Peptidase S49, SppA [Variovorax sp. WDL1]